MSETQTEYETEQETDAEPTPGPVAKGVTSSDRRRIAKVLKGTDMVGEHNTHCDIHSKSAPIQEQEPVANADLIVAAFNSAQEAQEMGYDALSFILNSAHLLRELENIANGDIEDGMTPAEVAQNALASAEGS